MSDLALYRKYRPSGFKEVVGQPQVVEVLEAAVKKGKVAHAYLFSGSRGTGKTSVARILARELKTSVNDMYEIDAASNRGIDEIRELREGVRTSPFDSKYKVYIIDEVHMLTTPAFNALLKTLEEPPEHVIFVLATTEVHKLPDTIISRCQSFTFRKPTQSELTKVILNIAKKEGDEIDKDAAALIALLAEGSYRDAIGTLQKVITLSGDKKLDRAEVERVTGAPKSALVQSFVRAVVAKDLEAALASVKEVTKAEVDMKAFLKLSLRLLRFVMLSRYDKDFEHVLEGELSKEELDMVKEMGKDSANLSAPLSALITAYSEIDRAYIKQLPLELALVNVLGQ